MKLCDLEEGRTRKYHLYEALFQKEFLFGIGFESQEELVLIPQMSDYFSCNGEQT